VGDDSERGAAAAAELDLERDVFLRNLLRELSGTLEEVVGLEEASGFISTVGQRIGARIHADYARALGTGWDREQVADVLVDLKRRIEGDFSVESISEESIVLTNRACPFGDRVIGRPSLCMMTSNVFGFIAAEERGYARVVLDETIAEGASGCRVTVWLEPTSTPPGDRAREYFGPDDADGD